jgi:hypothetical protein
MKVPFQGFKRYDIPENPIVSFFLEEMMNSKGFFGNTKREAPHGLGIL